MDESNRDPSSPMYGQFTGGQYGRQPGDKSLTRPPGSQVGIYE